MMKEFKEFAVRGNLIDTAVAFVMGAAFGKIVSSFVDGIVMPLVGMLTGGIDFNDKKWIIKDGIDAVKDATGKVITAAVPEVSVKYGVFITSVIDFVIVAFVVFIVIKAINKMKRKEEVVPAPAASPEPSSTDKLLMEIRDALKNNCCYKNFSTSVRRNNRCHKYHCRYPKIVLTSRPNAGGMFILVDN